MIRGHRFPYMKMWRESFFVVFKWRFSKRWQGSLITGSTVRCSGRTPPAWHWQRGKGGSEIITDAHNNAQRVIWKDPPIQHTGAHSPEISIASLTTLSPFRRPGSTSSMPLSKASRVPRASRRSGRGNKGAPWCSPRTCLHRVIV